MLKIQGLAVIAIVILLPMTLVLGQYISAQAKTLNYQIDYDNKLNNSTYDAVKAFQMNTANSDTSDIANSKIRDVKAGANTFFNSLANNFNMPGYSKETLSQFVPAVVFTMYDGYYIYTPYDNTLEIDDATVLQKAGTKPTYYDGQNLTGLKPYVYYSCRYKKGNIDVVITYSLDNYVSIHGISGLDVVDISGYLLSGVEYNPPVPRDQPYELAKEGEVATYKYGNNTVVNIDNEKDSTEEYAYLSGQLNVGDGAVNLDTINSNEKRVKMFTRMINGVRYYLTPGGSNLVIAMLNGSWRQQNYVSNVEQTRGKLDINKVRCEDVKNNVNALEYYKKSVYLKQKIGEYNLDNLTPQDACDLNGTPIYNSNDETFKPFKDYFSSNEKIFDFNSSPIEEPNSNFNEHRLNVIKYSIERNLAVAINNFNTYSTSSTQFEMPRLSEEEWNSIYDNICVISFLQGLSIGGRIYSGHSVIPNTDNKEIIKEDSLRFVYNNKIYNVTYNGEWINNSESINPKDIVNKMSLKRSSTEDLTTGETKYFYRYPENNLKGDTWFAYDSIVTTINNIGVEYGNMYKFMDEQVNNNSFRTAYYTALARERQGMYKVENESFVTNYEGGW